MATSVKDVGNKVLGFVTGGLAGDEDWGFLDDLFGGPPKAARDERDAALKAEGYVEEYGQKGLDTTAPFASQGGHDFFQYSQDVGSGKYDTDPSQFMTGGYNAPQRGQAPGYNQVQRGQAPGYNQFNPGQAPGYNQVQRGQAPSFNQFQREQGPGFERADAGNFDFNYEQSPGYQFAMEEGLKAIGGQASAKGARFGAGRDKDAMRFASGLAAQDYGQQYNRARGSFEADRGFGAGQADRFNQFGQRQHEFDTGIDQYQANIGSQFDQSNYWQGAGMDIGQNQWGAAFGQGQHEFNANFGAGQNQWGAAFDQGNYWQGANMDIGQNQWGASFDQGNYWQGAGMDQGNAQFGFNAGLASNNQNYGIVSGQNAFQANLAGGLATQGINSNQFYANQQQDMGTSMANAALGVGTANANVSAAPYNMAVDVANVGAQGAAAYFGGR